METQNKSIQTEGYSQPLVNSLRRVQGCSQIDMACVDSNPIGALYELVRAAKLEFDSICTHQDARQLQDGTWTYNITLFHSGVDYVGNGTSNTKGGAKFQAYRHVFDLVSPVLRDLRAKVRSSMETQDHVKVAAKLAHRMISEHIRVALKLSKFLNSPVVVHILGSIDAPTTVVDVDGHFISYQFLGDEYYVLSASSQYFRGKDAMDIADMYFLEPRTTRSLDGFKIFVHYDTVANSGPSETPIEPVAQVGVQDNPGTQTVPHLPNPQPTAVTPAMAIQDPSLVSALEPLLPHDFLNPIGAPNMLGVGGITFDIKDLIYSQFIDCDVQYQYTDDTPQGQIIFQIPYDPLSPYVNPYIHQWLQLHPRYTGAMNFRFTVVGNPTFSGLIGFAWYPRKINSNTVKVSEMMKYSYTCMGINEPSNRIFTLFDARQTQFWRDTGDDPNLNPRPVIVCFVYMTAVSPLKEGITIRIRVASKLSDGSDGPAFVAAEPTLPASNPGVGAPAPTGLNVNYALSLVGLPVNPVLARSIISNVPLYLTLDGSIYKPHMGVTETGDLIIDTPEKYTSPFQGLSPAYMGPTQVTAYTYYKSGGSSSDAVVRGFYILDLAKNAKLKNLVGNPPEFYNPLVIGFQKRFTINNNNDKDDANPPVPLDQIQPLLSKYVNIFQVVPYNVKIGGPNGEHPYGSFYDSAKTGYQTIHIDGLDVICIYTQTGPVFLSYYHIQAKDQPNPGYPVIGSVLMSSFLHDAFISVTQLSQAFPDPSWAPENMPSGWRNACITADPPFVVPKLYTSFQSYNHPSIQTIFDTLALQTSPTQCAQVTIGDLDSGSDLCYIRYYPDRRAAIINVGNQEDALLQASLVRPLNRTYISALAVVERSNTFPITNLVNFASNTAIVSRNARIRASKLCYDPSADGVITANAAAIAGSLISGAGNFWGAIGQGVSSYFQQKELLDWFKAYQENQNSFLSSLSAQDSTQKLHNAKQLAAFQQELAGYRTPGAVAGVNRAGLGSPGASYGPQNTSTGMVSQSTMTNAAIPPPKLTSEQGTSMFSKTTRDASTQVGPNPTATSGTQTNRPPGAINSTNQSISMPVSRSRKVGTVNAPRFRRQGISNPSGQSMLGPQTGVVQLGGQMGSLMGTSTA